MHLKIHVKSVHGGVEYICEHCEYKATTRSNLKIHIKSVHKGDKKSCEIDIEEDHEGKITSASKLEEEKTATMNFKIFTMVLQILMPTLQTILAIITVDGKSFNC